MNNFKKYFTDYFLKIKLSLDSVDTSQLNKIANLIVKVSKRGNKVIIVGNGGSASIASHWLL